MANTGQDASSYLTNGNQTLDSIISQLLGSVGTANQNYTAPAYTDVTNAQVRDMNSLQQQLGTNINTDQSAIQAIYDAATDASKNLDYSTQSDVERNYYNNMASAQNAAVDTIKQQQGNAIASGVNKGMTAANVLSTILGTSQSAATEATALAQQRQELGSKYAAQYAQNVKDALNTSTTNQEYLASLARQLYNDDIQKKTAELSYNQGINTDKAGVASSQYASDNTLRGALASAGTGVYNNNQSATAAIQSAIEAAEATKNYGTSYKDGMIAQANATKYAADKSTEATIYSANKAYGG